MARLDATRVAELRARGAAMSEDQAAAYALAAIAQLAGASASA